MVSQPFLCEVEGSDESSFSERGGPLRSQGEGAYQSVTSTKRSGGGTVMSQPFQEGGGGTVMSYPFLREGEPCGIMGRGYDGGPALTQYWLDDSFPMRGGRSVMNHSKGACPKGGEGGSTNHSQGEEVGGGQIMLMCPHSAYTSTH